MRFRFDEPRQKHAVAGKSVQFDVLNDFQPAFQQFFDDFSLAEFARKLCFHCNYHITDRRFLQIRFAFYIDKTADPLYNTNETQVRFRVRKGFLCAFLSNFF